MTEKKNPLYEECEKHPSYGLVSISRRTGNPGRLFGSVLRSHESYITIAVKHGERQVSHGHDRFYGPIRGDVLEFDMSAAQFAEFLTTSNVGTGVPCTLRYINNEKVESPPDVEVEAEKARKAFRKATREVSAGLEEKRKEVADILEDKKTLSKEDRKKILDVLFKAQQHLDSNAPFYLDQFEEATGRVIQHAKAEVDAFLTHNLISEGLKAVAQQALTPQLPASTENASEVE